MYNQHITGYYIIQEMRSSLNNLNKFLLYFVALHIQNTLFYCFQTVFWIICILFALFICSLIRVPIEAVIKQKMQSKLRYRPAVPFHSTCKQSQ